MYYRELDKEIRGYYTDVIIFDDGATLTSIWCDHGSGIPSQDQASIWELMSQSRREQTEQQGAGMGLPIVKGIITAHGGDVFLYSVPDQGTEVTLRLPLSQSEP